ncbi:MAG: hypothetical protein FRX49_08797 [Trebouxia sp. A1-2]|nr:MAG: hypothetical protein FRX49_08797 [Trebouxia sp. A1-2]
MTPSSVLGDRRTPGQLPDVTLGILVPVSLLSLRGKASSKLANSAGQQSAVSAILGDAKPTHFVSRAQARRCPAAQETLSDFQASAELSSPPSPLSQPAALDAPTTLVDEITEANAADPIFADDPDKITDDEPEWEVETILDHRHVKRGRKNKVEHLIKFLGYNTANDMWQQDMTNCEQLMQGCWDGKVGMLQLSLCHGVEGAFVGSPAVLHISNRDVGSRSASLPASLGRGAGGKRGWNATEDTWDYGPRATWMQKKWKRY